MPDAIYLRPRSLDEALSALAERPLLVLAGGTDVFPTHVAPGPLPDVLDIGGIAGLRGIERGREAWRIGALTRWADLDRTPLPPLFDGLKRAARQVGGLQIQNGGTLGGNLCNGSPAADAAPNLLALGAEVELASARGVRRLPLEAFLLGNRVTARGADEILSAILVPAPAGEARSAFLKLGGRRYLVISIVMAAFVLELEGGVVTRAGVAVGACAPTARRLPALEERLRGQRLRAGIEEAADAGCLSPLAPIDDIRASAAYRLDACLTLLRRGLRELAGAGLSP